MSAGTEARDPSAIPGAHLRERSSLSLTVPLGLAFAVWVAGALVPAWPSGLTPRPHIRTGTATELAPAIRAAPRAMVYFGNVWSVYRVPGQRRFEETAQRLVQERPNAGLQFFVIKSDTNTTEMDAIAWAESFQDERLAAFSFSGKGWLLWLEYGHLREVEPDVGRPTTKERDYVQQTLSFWR